MFGTLTLEQLYDLHTSLFRTHQQIHGKMIGPDRQPVLDALSGEWRVLSAACAEISETMRAVYGEVARREAEAEWDVARPAAQERITDA